MGLISKVAKAGLVVKAVDWARKPENQAKIKSAISQVKAKAQQRSQSRSS